MLSQEVKERLVHAMEEAIEECGAQSCIDTFPLFIPVLIRVSKANGWTQDELELTENIHEAEQVIAGVLGMM